MVFLIASLLGLAIAGICYAIGSVFAEGAENYNTAYEDEIDKSLQDIFLFIPAKRLVELSWSLAAVAFLLFAVPCLNPSKPAILLVGIVLGAIAGCAMFFVPNHYITFLKNRRRSKFNIQLVDALATMSNALRAGFSINQAFESVVASGANPIAQEFRVFLQQMRVGMNFSDSLKSLEERVGSDDLSLVTTAIDIARKTGGNLTEVFDTIAETIRSRQRIELRVKTLTAQGRLQGLIIGAMPFLLGGAMLLLKPDMMKSFLFSWIGLGTMALIIALVAIGGLIIKKIVTIDI